MVWPTKPVAPTMPMAYASFSGRIDSIVVLFYRKENAYAKAAGGFLNTGGEVLQLWLCLS
jgi:hypothetical protein